MSRADEAKIAIGIVEGQLASADSRAAYWAVELDLKLGMSEFPGDHKPGELANKFLEVAKEKYTDGTSTAEQTVPPTHP